VEFLNGAQLFDSMFAEDPDAEKLALLPGMEALLEIYPCYEWQNKQIWYKLQGKVIHKGVILELKG